MDCQIDIYIIHIITKRDKIIDSWIHGKKDRFVKIIKDRFVKIIKDRIVKIIKDI